MTAVAAPPPAYLKPNEVARRLHLHRQQLHRRLSAGELPTLFLTESIKRIEASALVPASTDPVPHRLPGQISLAWLSTHWRVSETVLRRLAVHGELPCWRRPLMPPGRVETRGRWCWAMRREDFLAFVQSHTVRA